MLRICWETTGAMHPSLLKKMAELSLKSGGIIKFDLKAWDEHIHVALCGVTNRRTLENFRYLSGLTKERPDIPLLAASTLLVPGYVDEIEVQGIARFIAAIDPDIPFTLLGFYPNNKSSQSQTDKWVRFNQAYFCQHRCETPKYHC